VFFECDCRLQIAGDDLKKKEATCQHLQKEVGQKDQENEDISLKLLSECSSFKRQLLHLQADNERLQNELASIQAQGVSFDRPEQRAGAQIPERR
jgi:hypothetical protein